jgi:hypothetical protein
MIYKLLEADTATDMEIKVNQKLADGWELYGDLATATKADTSVLRSGIEFAVEGKVILFQAVIKRSD